MLMPSAPQQNAISSNALDERIFVIASDLAATGDRFHGYAYCGSDIIIGEEGRRSYEAVRSKPIEFGLDGSYVLVRKQGDRVEIGTDYNGHGKLFCYRSGRYWAVSNSFFKLLEHVQSRSRPITLDLAHLAGFFVKNTMGVQLLSLRTAVREIELIPTHRNLCIEGGNLTSVVRADQETDQAQSYDEAMARFLAEWTSRIITLINSPVKMVCDITGGLDSRSVLAMVLAAGELVDDPTLKRIHFNSNSSQSVDFDIAKRLAKTAGVNLGAGTNLFSERRPTGERAYSAWQQLYFGTYTLLFAPNLDMPKDLFWLGGEGGESVRTFYRSDGPRNLLERIPNAVTKPELGKRLFDEALEDLEMIMREVSYNNDAGRAHYRNFRERFHGARRSDYVNAVSPLSGRSSKRIAELAGEATIESGQINRDIVANTQPGLLLVPFDSDSKPSGEKALSDCRQVRAWREDVDKSGQVFGYEPAKPSKSSGSQKRFLELLLEDFKAVYPNAASLSLFPEAYLKRASDALERAAKVGKFENITDSRTCAHVLFAGKLASVATGRISDPKV